MKKRLLSLLLSLTMIVGLLPMTTLTASAATTTVEVDTWDELKNALTASGTATIKLTGDIEETLSTLHLEVQYGIGDKLEQEPMTVVIKGTKTLDLNGYSIECHNFTNAYMKSYWNGETFFEPAIRPTQIGQWGNHTYADFLTDALFKIPAGTSLTVNDSGKNGSITFDGYDDDMDEFFRKSYTERDVFDVYGTLIINSGDIIAGKTEKDWVVNGLINVEYYKELGDNYYRCDGDRFDGYARRQIWGSAANVHDGGCLVVNGGKLTGRGSGSYWYVGSNISNGLIATTKEPTCKFYRDAVVECEAGGAVVINGGSFNALGGADVLAGDGEIMVRAGTYKTDKYDYVAIASSDDAFVAVEEGTYGNLGIPDSAWKNNIGRIGVMANGTVAYNLNALDLNTTGGQTEGDSLEVMITPVSTKSSVKVSGGPYNNSSVSANETIKWNAYSDDALQATVNYTPYYKDTTGLENYSVTYNWRVYGTLVGTPGSSNEDVDKSFTTTTNRVNVLEKAGLTTNFNNSVSITCTVVETADNLPALTGTIKSEMTPFKVACTKTPMDESALYGGKMETVISYPAGSSDSTPVKIKVNPLATNLSEYNNSTGSYEYSFRGIHGDTEDSSDTGIFESYGLDYGHVKVTTTLRVSGADGINKVFTDEAWALVLPNIQAVGANFDSAAGKFIAGSSTVTLKAPIDTVNAKVEADEIVEGDIIGWYEVTYDNDGEPVYSFIGNGGATHEVSENGTYCYMAYDRDGNKVYSAPAVVEFNADAYSISISRDPAEYSFYVYANNAKPVHQDIAFTATVGNAVESGNIRWRILVPVGFDTSKVATVNTLGGLQKNFSGFITSSYIKDMPVGSYFVQAIVYKDGVCVSSSNIVGLTVQRVENFVDITDGSGKVLSGTTIEGPASGTMQLNCVVGNGGSNPKLKSVDWSVESLVGTNVATIDQNGKLTINKPGQIKVTATATVKDGEPALADNTQTVIINIPVTNLELTAGTPAIGGDPNAIFSVPADAPYTITYSWSTGVVDGQFAANAIPEAMINFKPKDGYVFPAKCIEHKSFYEWKVAGANMTVSINGTEYDYYELGNDTLNDGYNAESNEYGVFAGYQKVSFKQSWDRLRDSSSTYLDYVNITANKISVGDLNNSSTFNHTCTNNKVLPYSTSVHEVSGDYLNDEDIDNDNAVSMSSGAAFEQGNTYRVTVYLSAFNGAFFTEDTTVRVNNEGAIIKPGAGIATLEGAQMARVYYYFIPKAEVKTINELYIGGISTPVGYSKPASAESITDFSSNFAVDDEVYISRMQWFYDINNNGKVDTGEDTTFNDDGTFKTGIPYSVYLELDVRDRDGDGKGDYVKFADNTSIKLTDMSFAAMTGNQNGAVYKFAAATAPAKAVTANPASVTINLEEGYDPIQEEVALTSVGTTEVRSIVAVADDTSLLNVSYNGMTVYMTPVSGLEEGRYSTVVYIQDDYGSVYTTIPVTINVGVAAEPEVLKGDVNNDGAVDMKDAATLQRHVLKVEYITNEAALAAADVTGDDNIDMKDAAKLMRYVLKAIDTLD